MPNNVNMLIIVGVVRKPMDTGVFFNNAWLHTKILSIIYKIIKNIINCMSYEIRNQ